jgi:hypothetical protein
MLTKPAPSDLSLNPHLRDNPAIASVFLDGLSDLLYLTLAL